MAEDFPHFGRVETPVVLPPPSQNGVVVSRKGAKTLGRLAGQMPLGDLLPHPLLGRAARPGQEARKEFSRAVLRPPRPKRKAQEGKLNRGIVAPAIAVLAVDNPRLVRVQLQPALPQAGRESLLHLLRLPLRAAMHYPVIGIACKRARRQLPSQPAIQGIVQEEIKQQRPEHAANNVAKRPLEFFIRLAREQLRPTYGQGFRGAPLQTDTEESRPQTIRAGGSRAKVTQPTSEVSRSEEEV